MDSFGGQKKIMISCGGVCACKARSKVMAEIKTEPVAAQYFEDIDEVRGVPGAFEYYKSGDRYPAGMIYCCPCGCGTLGSLPFRPATKEDRASWNWDGNREQPTLSPSVHQVGHWHGWLQSGIWKSV